MLQAPTIQDTISLFTLSDDQQAPFNMLVTTMHGEAAGTKQPQLRMVITGGPGCGKSQVLLAFMWHAFQHDCAHLITVMSYTWKAALNISSEHYPPNTSSTFFQINSFGANTVRMGPIPRQKVKENLLNCR